MFFLDYVAVADKGFLQEMRSMFEGSQHLDSSITGSLEDIFNLPRLDSCTKPHKSDRALQVVVSDCRSGAAETESLGEFGIAFFWRPKIKISARLYEVAIKETITQLTVSQKVKMTQYLNRAFSWKSMLRGSGDFSESDLELLVHEGCQRLLKELVKSQ